MLRVRGVLRLLRRTAFLIAAVFVPIVANLAVLALDGVHGAARARIAASGRHAFQDDRPGAAEGGR